LIHIEIFSKMQMMDIFYNNGRYLFLGIITFH